MHVNSAAEAVNHIWTIKSGGMQEICGQLQSNASKGTWEPEERHSGKYKLSLSPFKETILVVAIMTAEDSTWFWDSKPD